jgi:hypothetical protein
MFTVTAVFTAPYVHCHSAVFTAPYVHCHCSVQCSLCSLSLCSVHCSLCSLSLQCSLLPMFTVTAVFTSPYAHCHSAVFSAPYRHCHSAPYRRSAVEMNVPGPHTASHPNDAAASHSCHFNTVLYPRSYSQCQLPLNTSRRYIPGVASSMQNFHSHSIIFTAPLQTCQHIYI